MADLPSANNPTAGFHHGGGGAHDNAITEYVSQFQTAELGANTLNPQHTLAYVNKYSPSEYGISFKQVFQAAKDALYGVQQEAPTEWVAVVLRVDELSNGTCRFKARIPEQDAILPAPVEFIPRGARSCSHFLIDAHRTYVGTYDKSPPRIGQLVRVKIPKNSSLSTPGSFIKPLSESAYPNVKSSSPLGETLQTLEEAGLILPSTPGDALGAGEANPGNQVPPMQDWNSQGYQHVPDCADEYVWSDNSPRPGQAVPCISSTAMTEQQLNDEAFEEGFENG